MAEEKVREFKGPGGRHGGRGPRQKVKNPGKLMMRLLKYILSRYA